jgi:hypothetical protein
MTRQSNGVILRQTDPSIIGRRTILRWSVAKGISLVLGFLLVMVIMGFLVVVGICRGLFMVGKITVSICQGGLGRKRIGTSVTRKGVGNGVSRASRKQQKEMKVDENGIVNGLKRVNGGEPFLKLTHVRPSSQRTITTNSARYYSIQEHGVW